MPKNSTNIARRIKEIRDNKNLSQDRFGKKIGLSGKTISAYETGRSIPPYKVLEKIVEVYDTPFVQIRSERKESIKTRLQMLQNELIKIQTLIEGSLC